ncbi:RraA family protein [Amycolatopsis acidiphila]|uniref:hypothetical protein n=1 Tax=Amycolatopsis acidiphila TaxID=715473 RepID=UPI0035714F64
MGFWGSENTMAAITRGAVGVVTDDHCRETAEVERQRTPLAARHRRRTIIPGRIEVVEVQGTIGAGSAPRPDGGRRGRRGPLRRRVTPGRCPGPAAGAPPARPGPPWKGASSHGGRR